MPFQLDELSLDHPELTRDGEALRRHLDQVRRVEAPRLRRLWAYYRNAILDAAVAPLAHTASTEGLVRPYRQAQEWGLPPRITGVGAMLGTGRKEVVIENDIGWRIDAQIDFLFGQELVISPAVADNARRKQIDGVLRAIFTHNGGLGFFQKLALLGAVYGYVDVLVKYVPTKAADDGESDVDRLARAIRFEIVEPTRAVPITAANDATQVVAYAQTYQVPRGKASRSDRARREAVRSANLTLVEAVRRFLNRRAEPGAGLGASQDWLHEAEPVEVLEVIAPTRWQRYEDERLVAEGENSLGVVPVVHIQNAAVPFEYAGKSDVEPLVPLQDELNTRLSDRAYRITMQSFKMYLGKGIDDFIHLPIAPGRMYATDNEHASIQEFGGDTSCPSEQAHLDEIREALDKTSGVSPIAAGAIKNRIGRLSSAAALRVTLLALLGRTERKRTTYGPAIERLCELALAWLDRAGLFATTPLERRVELYWPNPIPANEQEQIDTAKAKKDLGIDPAQVARELGY